MRRTLLLVLVTAVVTSLITSVTVSAATSGKHSAPSDRSEAVGARLPVIVDTRIDCGSPPPGQNWKNQDDLERTIRCLEDELVNVNRFMKSFFRCARIIPVTQYGSFDNTFGYEFFNPGDPTPILTTALDFTIDPTIEAFEYFMLWQNTDFCLS